MADTIEESKDVPVATDNGEVAAQEAPAATADGQTSENAQAEQQAPEGAAAVAAEPTPPPIAAEAGQADLGQEPAAAAEQQPLVADAAAAPAEPAAAQEVAGAEAAAGAEELTMNEAEVAAKLAQLEQPSGPPALYGKVADDNAGAADAAAADGGTAADGGDAADGSAADGGAAAADGAAADGIALPASVENDSDVPAADGNEAAAAKDSSTAAAEAAETAAAPEPVKPEPQAAPEAEAVPEGRKSRAVSKSGTKSRAESDTEGTGVRTHHARSKSKREKDIESLGDAVHPPSPSKIKQEVWLDGTFKTEKGRVITAQELCQSVERMTNAHINKYLASQQAGAGGPGAPGAPAGTVWNSKMLSDDELEGAVSRLYQVRSREEALGEAGKLELLQLKFDENGKEAWVPAKKSSVDEQKEYLCGLYDRCWESKKRTEAELAAKYLQPLGRPRKA